MSSVVQIPSCCKSAPCPSLPQRRAPPSTQHGAWMLGIPKTCSCYRRKFAFHLLPSQPQQLPGCKVRVRTDLCRTRAGELSDQGVSASKSYFGTLLFANPLPSLKQSFVVLGARFPPQQPRRRCSNRFQCEMSQGQHVETPSPHPPPLAPSFSHPWGTWAWPSRLLMQLDRGVLENRRALEGAAARCARCRCFNTRAWSSFQGAFACWRWHLLPWVLRHGVDGPSGLRVTLGARVAANRVNGVRGFCTVFFVFPLFLQIQPMTVSCITRNAIIRCCLATLGRPSVPSGHVPCPPGHKSTIP